MNKPKASFTWRVWSGPEKLIRHSIQSYRPAGVNGIVSVCTHLPPFRSHVQQKKRRESIPFHLGRLGWRAVRFKQIEDYVYTRLPIGQSWLSLCLLCINWVDADLSFARSALISGEIPLLFRTESDPCKRGLFGMRSLLYEIFIVINIYCEKVLMVIRSLLWWDPYCIRYLLYEIPIVMNLYCDKVITVMGFLLWSDSYWFLLWWDLYCDDILIVMWWDPYCDEIPIVQNSLWWLDPLCDEILMLRFLLYEILIVLRFFFFFFKGPINRFLWCSRDR